MKFNSLSRLFLIILLSLSLAGCTFIFQRGRRSDVQKIEELSRQVNNLSEAKSLLEDRLNQEIKDKQVKLQMMEKGLVITVVGDVLFDSGKAKIRSEAYPLLDKVALVLRENVPQFNIGIEGHTDNVPIRFSGWKSNWDLASARSLSVLHYFIDKRGISPERLSAISYGEYQPVASNDIKEGRQLNRRVEMVILPELTKVKEGKAEKDVIKEPQENLK